VKPCSLRPRLQRLLARLVLACALAQVSCKRANIEEPAASDAPRAAVGQRSESPPPTAPDPDAQAPFKLAFGSCNHQDKPQPLWEVIANTKPDAWLWLGDIVYADSLDDVGPIVRAYAKLKAQPAYAALTANIPVLGTWDDHDFGKNDGGSEHRIRSESQKALLDFLGEPPLSPRRSQLGVYTAHVLAGGRLKLLLLDTRFNRDPYGPEGDVLGEAQWRWLEEQLSASSAQAHLVGSSIQVLPTEHRSESWSRFPRARARLLSLLAERSAAPVVLLSGDRHFAEISELLHEGRRLVEVTSSGLTHSWEKVGNEPNSLRQGAIFSGLNFGLATLQHSSLTVEVLDKAGMVQLTTVVPLGETALAPRSPGQ
jgi:alkaline phosphatase D